MPKNVECFFCGRYGARSLEHVFADTWLCEFQAGQERTVLDRRLFDGDALQDTRAHTFNSFLCGDVCDTCNTGWMSSLESTVKPWILSITTKADLHTLQDPVRGLTFSRWALKTACVIDRLGGIREIPAHVPRRLTNHQETLPDDVHVLVGWHPFDQPSLFSFNQRNTWSKYPREATQRKIPDEGWFKVAFSIERLMVLVAAVPSTDFQLVIGTGVHVPVWPNTKIELHHWFHVMRLEGLAPPAALKNFSDLLAVSRDGRMW